MRRSLTILSVGVLMGCGAGVSAQDIHFSQFYENAVLRNPGLTGIFPDDYKVGIDYRNQWGSVGQPFSTTMLSGETRILVNRDVADYLSFGLVGTIDKAGSTSFTTTQIYPAICYNKTLEDQHNTYLSVGLTGGYRSRYIDQSKITTANQYQGGVFNPGASTGETTIFKNMHNFDVGAGVSLNSSLDLNGRLNYYAGVSAYHLNGPAEEFAVGKVTRRMKMQFNAGFHCPLADKFSFTAHGNYSVQGPYTEFIVGGLFTYKSLPVGLPSTFSFHFGAFVRVNDAFIPTLKIDYRNLSIGYSYDNTNSSLAVGASGAYANEFTLYVRGNLLHRKDPRDLMLCPKFGEPLDNYREN